MNLPQAGVGSPNRVVVLGGGVTGLTTAVRLAEAGHQVQVVADGYMRETTSWIATAIWHVFWVSLNDRVVTWAADSLNELMTLSEDTSTGVTRVRGLECIRSTAPQSDLVHGELTDFWRNIVPFYEPLSRAEVIGRLPEDYPSESISGGYLIEVPIADMSVYLPYLMNRLSGLAVPLDEYHAESFSAFKAHYPADVYVNCTGLGSKHLASDGNLTGVKGQVVRVSRGSISEYIADDFSPRGMTYVLPRGNDIILGGSEDEGTEDSDIDLEFGQRIIDRCTQLIPSLTNHEVLEHMAGVRPYRRGSIRLERDTEHPDIIHNYGHGGSGVSLSWGCADEVVRLVASDAVGGVV